MGIWSFGYSLSLYLAARHQPAAEHLKHSPLCVLSEGLSGSRAHLVIHQYRSEEDLVDYIQVQMSHNRSIQNSFAKKRDSK